jgi:ATP-dependent DNA helicase PIF1
MKSFVIHAQKLNGENNPENDDIFICRIPMPSGERDYPVSFTRMQIPILLSYYLTISRAKGQSLTKAGLYLPRNVFSQGHLMQHYPDVETQME